MEFPAEHPVYTVETKGLRKMTFIRRWPLSCFIHRSLIIKLISLDLLKWQFCKLILTIYLYNPCDDLKDAEKIQDAYTYA